MNSTGFDATAAKLAALEQRIALTSNNKQEGVLETLSREQVVILYQVLPLLPPPQKMLLD